MNHMSRRDFGTRAALAVGAGTLAPHLAYAGVQPNAVGPLDGEDIAGQGRPPGAGGGEIVNLKATKQEHLPKERNDETDR